MPESVAGRQSRDDLPTIVRWARIALTLALVPVAAYRLNNPGMWLPLIGDINVAVHEFGHMLFMPFGVPVLGETMVILGGSLVQVLFPAVFVGYFTFGPRKHRDLHAATICVWWLSISLLELSVYVADARARDLTLINGLTGRESDSHDWYNLLSQWGLLQYDLVYARTMRVLAGFLLVVSTVGGIAAAWFGGRSTPKPADTAVA